MASNRAPAIGIDLGTTYSCVGVYRNGRVEIIANESGHRITPSYVAFSEEGRLVGDAAKECSFKDPHNIIFDVKRLMGKTFIDENVQQDKKSWPFDVIDNNGSPEISVKTNDGRLENFTPQQISAMILSKMKAIAEAYLGCKVVDAVVTVPAYFDNNQNEATIDAGKIAKLNVLQILKEPTSAALAYGLDEKITHAKNVLIFDLGGGTFDVAIMTIENGRFEVKAISGDSHLGGQDFDKCLMEHFIEEFKRKNGKDITTSVRSMMRLRKACESAKRSLSSAVRANIDVDCLFDGIDFHSSITRVRFNQLCNDLFESTLGPVDEALHDAEMTVADIDNVVLVGGSTRIVKIQELLQTHFNGKELTKSIHPDEAVAFGAAVKAAILTGQYEDKNMDLLDVTPSSLGIETVGGLMSKIILKNTRIPVNVTKKDYTTFRDNQTELCIKVYQGESELTKDNKFLGSFNLMNIQRAPRGVPSIDITFEKGKNDILKVSAVDRCTGTSTDLEVRCHTGRLEENELARMIDAEEAFVARDEQRDNIDKLHNDIEAFCLNAKSVVERIELPVCDTQDVITTCDEALEWLEMNDMPNIEELNNKLEILKIKCNPVLERAKLLDPFAEPSFDM